MSGNLLFRSLFPMSSPMRHLLSKSMTSAFIGALSLSAVGISGSAFGDSGRGANELFIQAIQDWDRVSALEGNGPASEGRRIELLEGIRAKLTTIVVDHEESPIAQRLDAGDQIGTLSISAVEEAIALIEAPARGPLTQDCAPTPLRECLLLRVAEIVDQGQFDPPALLAIGFLEEGMTERARALVDEITNAEQDLERKVELARRLIESDYVDMSAPILDQAYEEALEQADADSRVRNLIDIAGLMLETGPSYMAMSVFLDAEDELNAAWGDVTRPNERLIEIARGVAASTQINAAMATLIEAQVIAEANVANAGSSRFPGALAEAWAELGHYDTALLLASKASGEFDFPPDRYRARIAEMMLNDGETDAAHDLADELVASVEQELRSVDDDLVPSFLPIVDLLVNQGRSGEVADLARFAWHQLPTGDHWIRFNRMISVALALDASGQGELFTSLSGDIVSEAVAEGSQFIAFFRDDVQALLEAMVRHDVQKIEDARRIARTTFPPLAIMYLGTIARAAVDYQDSEQAEETVEEMFTLAESLSDYRTSSTVDPTIPAGAFVAAILKLPN